MGGNSFGAFYAPLYLLCNFIFVYLLYRLGLFRQSGTTVN